MEQKILIKTEHSIKKINAYQFLELCKENNISDENFINDKFQTLYHQKEIISIKDIKLWNNSKIAKIKKKDNNISGGEWMLNKAERLWLMSDDDNNGYLDYNEFDKNVCQEYKGLSILPQYVKKMLFNEIAGEDGKISRQEFKRNFFKICKNYLNVVKSKNGKKVELFTNKGMKFKMKKNNNLVLIMGIIISFISGMLIMHNLGKKEDEKNSENKENNENNV